MAIPTATTKLRSVTFARLRGVPGRGLCQSAVFPRTFPIPPESSGGDDEGSSSKDPGPRPPWWPEDWPWPPPSDEPVVIESPPPLPNIVWPRLPPDHPYHLPPGYHYPDNLPEGHSGHYYPGMPPHPVIAP